jgi:hypothetical protein
MPDLTVADRTAAMHRRLEQELDELVGTGMLLDPAALRRLRSVIDAAIPVADAYAEAVSALSQDAVA